MDAALPAALRAAADRLLEGVSRRDLAERSRRTTGVYRAGGGSRQAIAAGADAAAYLSTRMPATYAADLAAMTEAARLTPAFSPRSLLDAGAGPGGASWAALEAWPSLDQATLFDANPRFLDLARALAAEGPPALRDAAIVKGDLARDDLPAADLVVASYALAEIAPGALDAVAARLWAATHGLLVLVEPGTPAGFARLRAARTALVAAGAHVVAPCPHDRACPMAEPDWCHFAQRLPRSRDHRQVKAASVPYEDEKFAYLAAARTGVAASPAPARILAPPRAAKPATTFKLCTPDGLAQRQVPRRDRAAFAASRRLGWGDAFAADDT